MADLTITATNVVAVSGNTVKKTCGATAITQGKVVFEDTSASDVKISDANVTSLAQVSGVALTSSAPDQPVVYLENGGVLGGLAGVTAGTTYCLSATAGNICPQADLTTNDRVIRLGYGLTTATIKLDIADTGVVL